MAESTASCRGNPKEFKGTSVSYILLSHTDNFKLFFSVILQKSTLSAANNSKPILVLHKENLFCTRKTTFFTAHISPKCSKACGRQTGFPSHSIAIIWFLRQPCQTRSNTTQGGGFLSLFSFPFSSLTRVWLKGNPRQVPLCQQKTGKKPVQNPQLR